MKPLLKTRPKRMEVSNERMWKFADMKGKDLPTGMAEYIRSRDEMMCGEAMLAAITDWLAFVPDGEEYNEVHFGTPIVGALWEWIDILLQQVKDPTP